MGGWIYLKEYIEDNGTVTRGVSVVDENGLLSQAHETTGIEMGEDGKSNATILKYKNGLVRKIKCL